MKKLFVILNIAVLLSLCFCGCQESSDNQNDNQVELIHYNIKTEISQLDDEYKIISGIVKNIAGKTLNSIEVIINFYDSNNSFLRSKSDILINIPDTNTREFNISYYSSNKFYKEVDWNNIRFDFSVT